MPSAKSLTFFLLVACASLVGCRDEQVLYQIDSEEVIPPVPDDRPGGVHVSPQAGPVAASILPDPREAIFQPPALEETVAEVKLLGLSFALPERFRASADDNPMRAALYQVLNAAGEPTQTELTVFFFGQGQGGGMRDNAGRWLSQFTAPEGNETPLQRFQTGTVGPLEVTRMTLEGTYTGAAMMSGAPPIAREGWALDGLIVEGGPQGSLFFRLTGPAHEVQSESKAMEMLAASLAVAPGGATVEGPREVSRPPDPEGEVVQLSRVEAPGVAFAVPSAWQASPVTSSMRALQFGVPGAAGEAELVVFYFGKEGGGSKEENIRRWVSQVGRPQGAPEPEIHSAEHGPFSLTTLYLEGTYGPTPMMPGAPAAAPKENQGFFGMIVEGGKEGPLYIRLTGPAETVREIRPIMSNVAGTLEEN